MVILYNKMTKKMYVLMGSKLAHIGKGMDFQLAATLPTEQQIVFKPTTDYLICPNFFEFNVYKQANVNIAIRSRMLSSTIILFPVGLVIC